MRVRAGFTPPRDVDEHRELRHAFDPLFGFGGGFVTRRHGTVWISVRWGAAAPSRRKRRSAHRA